jgi:hypothetical protein
LCAFPAADGLHRPLHHPAQISASYKRAEYAALRLRRASHTCFA